MSPTSCCFVFIRFPLSAFDHSWSVRKKAAINLSVDCRFFSVIAGNSAQMFVAISLRRHRRDLAKERREMALVLKAGAQPDLDYRQLAFDQQPLGEINPAPGQELNGRRAGGLFERPREVERAQLRYLGDFGQRQVV